MKTLWSKFWGMRWWWKAPILLVAAVVVIGLVAPSPDEPADTAAATSSATGTAGVSAPLAAATSDSASPAPTTEPTATPTPEQASNQRQIGDLLLTVNGAAAHADSLFPADAGTHYVAIDVTAQNTGGGTYALNVFNFRLQDSDGFVNDRALTAGPEPLLGHHEMVPGQTVRGYIVFKLGDGREPTELQYQSFTGTPGTIAIP